MTPFYPNKNNVNTVKVRSPTPIDECCTKNEISEVLQKMLTKKIFKYLDKFTS